MRSERGWTGERWEGSDRWRGEPDRWRSDVDQPRGPYGRSDWDRSGAAARGWNDPDYGYRPSPGYGYGEGTTGGGWGSGDWRIDASDVEVIVNNREVTLSGAGHSRDEKRSAEDVIESISGVRDVHNNLRVSR